MSRKKVEIIFINTKDIDIDHYPVIEGYNKNLLRHMKKLASKIKEKLGNEIALVFSGTSGMFLATLISRYFENCLLIQVRKPNESLHTEELYHKTGTLQKHKVVFIDDLVSSGETFTRCAKIISRHKRKIEAVALMSERVFQIYYKDRSDMKSLKYIFLSRSI